MTAAFYCMSSDVYFLAAVAMVNSLRLVGHTEEIYLLDCGLSDEQRALLSDEVTILAGASSAPHFLLKTVAPSRHPAQTMVLMDADMIVTRRLDEPIREAAAGRVVAGATGLDRFADEWSEVLGLGPLTRHPYVSSAIVFLGGELGAEILALVDARVDRVDFERTYFRGNDPAYPLLHAEEDVLNAAIAARAKPDQLVAFDPRLSAAPPYAGLRMIDPRSLRCAYDDGTEPYVVHSWLAKPWLEPTHHGVYSQLLRRLLIGDDVAVRVPESMVPLRFRHGARALAERKRINARERWRWHVREPLARLARGPR